MPYNYYQPFQQTTTGINWVQGEAGARSWAMAPNSIALLMDSEAQRFFIKQTDASGMPLPLRVFHYQESSVTPQNVALPVSEESVEYVTKREFEQRLAALEGGQHESTVRTTARKSAEYTMHKQMDYICNEIDELEAKIEKDGGLTKPDVQYLDTLWHLKKDMLASSQMEENDYSNDSGMSREGSYRGSYADSYDEGSYRDERSYARGRTRAPRDSMGRYVGYSRKGEDVIEVLDDLRGIVRKLPNDAKYEVERIIKKHENVHA